MFKGNFIRKGRIHTKAILEGNDKLTRFYTGLPTYNSFIAFVTYLEPKAMELRPWNGSKTRGEDEKVGQSGARCFTSLTIVDQLFSVLIRLRRGLDAMDVCVHFRISEATYSRLFTTWITFLSKELRLLFPFPLKEHVLQWIPPSFKKYFPNTRIIIDCYEIECQ